MNRSFFTATRDAAFVAGSATFAAGVQASYAQLGLTLAQSAAYQAVDAALQSAYQAAVTPATRTKSAVAAKEQARARARQMASNLTRIISGNPTVSAQQRIDLGIAVPVTPTPRPAPGTPYQFKVGLAGDGSVTLTWKCDNPRGSTGTLYQVSRRIGPAGELTYLGGAGTKQFTDATLPAGTAQATYQVQAVRSTAVGASAQHTVNFGVTNAAPAMPFAAEEPTMRRAA